MSWPVLLVVVLMAAFAAAIPWAIRADRADRAAEYHLIHCPNSNCPECEES